ncbi:Myb/SANT-like domain [Arabidopsis thaliana x Arabidopsis arenosa]|uniref:Myb/SANT-like domain n=1 Tax=Arabidopsis thaliana x Arabidopsis arenosa TaxID=1240361 RepID=A0A8T1ZLW7_9BRAS|nr:Myb/SANT-like domain [Arabidopsis thaliana x Arabidopsis arenosa]
MGDSQKSKEKGPYNQWGPEETKLLVELLVDAVHRNWRDNSGIFSKLTVEQKILPVLNERLGCQKNHTQYLSRWKYLRGLYQNYLDLQRFNSGFGWDNEMKMFTAPDEVWDEYLRKHPKHKHLRYESNEQFEDLQVIFGCGLATGGSAIGMGDTIDARTIRTGESTRVRDNIIVDEVFELSSEEPLASPECDMSPIQGTNPKGRVDKLRPRKRSRTLATSNVDKLKTDEEDPMIIVSNRILNVIQQREERQQREAEKREENLRRKVEEKEAEKKKNNVWEAMKEIPNLENHIRYKAVTLIHSLGMKDVFIDMSVEERFGWIQSNVGSI